MMVAKLTAQIATGRRQIRRLVVLRLRDSHLPKRAKYLAWREERKRARVHQLEAELVQVKAVRAAGATLWACIAEMSEEVWRQAQAAEARRRAEAPLRPKAAQKPADIGLFSDDSRQTDFVDLARRRG